MLRPTVRQIEADLRSPDPRVAKGGVQAACELLEGRVVAARTRRQLSRALSTQLDSDDANVLRWNYKLIALLGDPTYVPYLQRQLGGRDLVPENRTWTVAALGTLAPDHLRVLYDVGEELTTAYALAAEMYGRSTSLRSVLRRGADSDDPLAQQWLGLLYGQGRIDLAPSILTALTSSASPEVVEYAIWGIRLRRAVGVEVIAVDPLGLRAQPVNVRRWYYRTVAQDPEARNAYAAQVIDWIEQETESKALEGLARGLHDSPKDRFWRGVERDWRKQERDPFVLRALGVPVSSTELAADPAGAVPILLDVDRPLRLRELPGLRPPIASGSSIPILTSVLPPTRPFARKRFIVLQDNRVTVNNSGTIGQVAGAHSAQHAHQQLSTQPSPSVGELLGALAQHLRGLPPDGVPDTVLTELDDLLAEDAEALDTDAGTRRRFAERLKGLLAVVRGLGSATEATTELVRQVEGLAHTISG